MDTVSINLRALCIAHLTIKITCRCFLITHSHLDLVNGLVLSAGSVGGKRRQVYGAQHTLEDLSTIFSGRIWPKLASWNEEDPLPLLLSP